jgi:SNF2 family DNA or RNA helicase
VNKGADQSGDEDNKDRADAEEYEVNQIDAYGNRRAEKSGEEGEEDSEKQTDADKVKNNMRNSSKIYYKITHSVMEEIVDQPSLLKGGVLKSYQMKGLNWMISLYNNNLNGILADEMGLGKTIQTISLFAYLIEHKNNEGPFLIVVPLTTINNWMSEFEKWAPDIHVITYKGKKHERPMLAQHLKNEKFHVVLTTYEYILNDKSTLCKIQW